MLKFTKLLSKNFKHFQSLQRYPASRRSASPNYDTVSTATAKFTNDLQTLLSRVTRYVLCFVLLHDLFSLALQHRKAQPNPHLIVLGNESNVTSCVSFTGEQKTNLTNLKQIAVDQDLFFARSTRRVHSCPRRDARTCGVRPGPAAWRTVQHRAVPTELADHVAHDDPRHRLAGRQPRRDAASRNPPLQRPGKRAPIDKFSNRVLRLKMSQYWVKTAQT